MAEKSPDSAPEKLSETAILTLVKNKLNGERVKLWLPPYTEEDGSEAPFTIDLKNRFAEQLKLPLDEVTKAVDFLRDSSLERQNARNQFGIDSVATLKIKVTRTNKEATSSKENIFVKTKLDAKGSYIKQQVALQRNVQADEVKAIANGRLIMDDLTLQEQNISVSTPIMAIILQKPDGKASSTSFLVKVREDAEILANQTLDADGDSFMEITDQNNRPIEIPQVERKAMVLAMILNEKGKSALIRKNYAKAILLLLEADKEFQKCGSDLLTLVDNYALLCMDITWCYLCLRSIEDLPDAEKRLTTCEEYLNRSYGAQLERLKSIKGSTGCESAVFVRLKLLKGIASFHRRQWKTAESCFAEVERELKGLTIDDEKLSQVMAMGYSTSESRLALRSCKGDVQMAVEYLLKKAMEREERKKQEELEKQNRHLGKTTDGQWVKAEFYNKILSMGYPSFPALLALKQSNNNISLAIQILQEQPELLNLSDTSLLEAVVNDEMINKVVGCGFAHEAAKGCLLKHGGNVQAAIEELVATGGIFLEEMKDTSMPSSSSIPGSFPSTSASSNDHLSSLTKDVVNKRQMQNAAFKRLKADISKTNYEDSHLDLTLQEELEFLEEYKVLMRYAKR